jgi:hypothetical protein
MVDLGLASERLASSYRDFKPYADIPSIVAA